jgi:flavorubredoxin
MFGKKKKKALVMYYTKTGHTETAALAVARGLEAAKAEVTIKSLADVEPEELGDYAIIAVGSPTRGGKPARKVKKFLKRLPRKALKGKQASVFSAYAGMRGKATLRRMRKLLKKKKAKVKPRGVAVKAGAPLSLWKGPDPTGKSIERLEDLGRKLAKKA